MVAGLAELGVAEDGPIDAYSGGAFQRLYGDRVVAELQKRQGLPSLFTFIGYTARVENLIGKKIYIP